MESSEDEVVAEGAWYNSVNYTYPSVSLTRLSLPQGANSFVCHEDVQDHPGRQTNANHSDQRSAVGARVDLLEAFPEDHFAEDDDTWAEDEAVDVGWSMLDHVNHDMGSRYGH